MPSAPAPQSQSLSPRCAIASPPKAASYAGPALVATVTSRSRIRIKVEWGMQPGDVVDERFEIERLAGRGGMGMVYRAQDRLHGETVALKVLRDAGGLEAERFAREALVLAELRHP